MKHSVVYAFPISHRFRLPFHNLLRQRLAEHDIDYSYVYSPGDNAGKGDTADIPWATAVPSLKFGRWTWQCGYAACRAADLVILQQQNNMLLNYPVLLQRRLCGQRVALMGHGRNMQIADPNSINEAFKRRWSRQVDWWFAYTERCADTVEGFGFPHERITVFNNAADVASMKADRAQVTIDEVARLRDYQFGGSDNIGIVIGGLYAEKRIGFLIDATMRVRSVVPDFQLVVIGDGPDAGELRAAALPWIHFLGPQFGPVKAMYAACSKLLLMPGLVGLGVLDGFAYRLPVIATDYPFHSPEIDYLRHGVNGLIVAPYTDARRYAETVVGVLRQDTSRQRLAAGAAASVDYLTIENMVERFAGGVMAALAAPVNRTTGVAKKMRAEETLV